MNTNNKNNILDLVIDLLVLLLSVNIFHYGQVLLPIICVLLLIKNRFVFKVHNVIVFVILVFFGISFLLFTYKNGMYSVMGLCIPMSYYVGSNLEINDDKDVKKIIYIITIGMVIHLMLNYGYEIYRFGFSASFSKINRYDFWTRSSISSTGIAVNSIMIISCFYYLLKYENKKCVKIIGILMFVLTMLYMFAMKRRTPFIIFGIIIIFSLLFDYFINKNLNKQKLMNTFLLMLAIVTFVCLIYIFDVFGFKTFIDKTSFFSILKIVGLKTGRLEILKSGLKYLPSYLFGGAKISSIIGYQFHDLLFDIYDYAGIIPFILMSIYYIYIIIEFILTINNKKIDKGLKMLLLSVYFTFFLMTIVEPLITGASIYVIVMIIQMTYIQKYTKKTMV